MPQGWFPPMVILRKGLAYCCEVIYTMPASRYYNGQFEVFSQDSYCKCLYLGFMDWNTKYTWQCENSFYQCSDWGQTVLYMKMSFQGNVP